MDPDLNLNQIAIIGGNYIQPGVQHESNSNTRNGLDLFYESILNPT